MNMLPVLLFVGSLPALLACNQTCQELSTEYDDSSGSYTLTPPSAPGKVPAPVTASLTADDPLTVAATGSSVIQVYGTFIDADDQPQEFTLTIYGGAAGIDVPLGAGSQCCLNDLACGPLTGTLDASAYAVSCQSSGCALTISGELKAATMMNGALLSFDAQLDHADSWTTSACPSEQTEGS